MTERAKSRLDLSIFRRRRELRGELRDADWSVGAGFALALFLLTWLGRLAMLTLAVPAGLVRGFSPQHWLWLASELAHDLWVALALGLLVGGLLRVTPARVRWLGIALGYGCLLTGSLIVIVSVPLYAALQTTLQLTQLLLAGGFSDLFDAGLATLPWPLYILLALLLVAAGFSVPFLARFAQQHLRALSRFGVGLAAGLLPVGLALIGRLAPEEAAQTLQMSAVYEFVASATRYYVRTQARAVDMHGAPHFQKNLMFGQAPPVEPLDSLVQATAKLPLSRPNVILVVLESASTLHTGLWNGRPQDTPRMSEISQHGLMFDDYYTAAPVSMKSLFSISCATYPQALPEAETYTNPAIDCQSISELLKQQNYRTALFHGGHFTYTRKDAFFKHRKYDVMRDGAALQNRKKYKRVMWGADDRAVMDDTLAWLDQTHNDPNPFFLHLIFLAPHEPYEVKDAPTPFPTKKAVDRYRNATALIDSQVGRLWDYLKSHSQTDNTLLVLVGDHGESFGEHRGDFMHGGRIYETAVRTPLMLVNPQLFNGKRSPRIGNHTDLVPTILDVIGLEKPARHQGASLLRDYQPHMIYFYGDWQRHYLGLRDGQWKYIYTVDRDRHELYDLTKDRAEKDNLALLHPQQVRAYTDRLLAWEQFQRELIPNYERLVNGAAACADKEMCWLDELKPSFQHGTLRVNKSAGGFPLQLGKRSYDRGLGVTPLSIVRYNIRGYGFTRFRGGVGHHPLGKNANLSLKVSTEIYLDDRLIWSSGKLAADEPAKLFDLDVREGSVLELIGYDVDAETWRDFIDWVDLRLTR